MDDEVLFLILGLLVVGGWGLGIRGFFLSRRALRELQALRQQLAATTPHQAPEAEAEVAPRPALPAALPAEPEAAEADASFEPDLVPIPDEPPSSRPPAPGLDLETLLTTRWGVWAGAAALLMAAVFLVRYAVEQDLLGPAVRCTLAALLGVALTGAAEWLRRRPAPKPANPTLAATADLTAPALAAAGVGALFGGAYGASVLYELIPPLAGFVLMAAASIAGLALALLHGQLVAAIGLIGAFASPALVQTDNPSWPGLFAYLLFVTATSLGIVRYTAWIWLGWATTIAGAVWVLVALAAGPGIDAWAPAFFVPAAAALNFALLPAAALDHPIGRRLAWVPVAALGATGLLLASAMQTWDTRAGLLLLCPVTVVVGAREARLCRLPWVAAVLALLLLADWSIEITDWPGPLSVPRDWTPAVVAALTSTAALVAGFFAAAGLWFQERRARPLPWASLAASVPVLALAICYWRVALFQTRIEWAVVAFALAAGLTGIAALAIRGIGVFGRGHLLEPHQHRQVAGVHAAGAVAALALGCAMLLADQWLTLTISLLLPALAWIDAEADLPGLRKVALAVAALVLIRLLANWYVFDYAFGQLPVLNGLLAAYGVPAVGFWYAGRLFRRRGDDLTVAVLEAGAIAFATVLVMLEIRHAAGEGSLTGGEPRFAEAALHVSALAFLAIATMQIATRLQRPVLVWAWRVQGALALFGGLMLLGPANPLFTSGDIGAWPVLDWLLPAYLLPAALAGYALSRPATESPTWLRRLLGFYALVAGFVWVTLEVRHLFHRDGIELGSFPWFEDAEVWAWSAAWTVYGGLLLVLGLYFRHRALRLGGLTIIALTTAKVFIIDMSGLEGLWRVLSFLGLGLALIGLGSAYRRLSGGAPAPAEQA